MPECPVERGASSAGHTEDEIFTEFLGLGSGLRVSEFEYVPERFAIPDYSRKVLEVDGKFQIKPQPRGTCEVRFRSSPTDRAFNLIGSLYTVPLVQNGPVRVSAPPVELVFRSNKVDLHMSIKLGEKMPLGHWYTYSKLKLLSLNGRLHLELWHKNHKIDTSVLIDRKPGADIDWESIHSLSSAIKSIADERNIEEFSFSLSDINKHIGDLGYLFQGVSPTMRFECGVEDSLAPGVTSLLYYSVAQLTDWTFAQIVSRQVLQDTVVDGRRRITAGAPKLVEMYALKNAGQEELEMIEGEYMRVLHLIEEKEHPLGFGELGSYVRALQALDNP